jgi:hypothetical protein
LHFGQRWLRPEFVGDRRIDAGPRRARHRRRAPAVRQRSIADIADPDAAARKLMAIAN